MELIAKEYKFEAQKLFANINPDLVDALFDAEVIIAGGIVSRLFSSRDTEKADIDVYFRSKESLANVLRFIRGTGNIVFDYTEKSVMIKSDDALVQFIIIDFCETIEEVFSKFDFTVVMGAFDTRDEKFYFHPDFLHDNSQRRLVYNPGTMFPIISSLRVQKYINEGYTISRNEFLKIMISIMDLRVESWSEIESQFGRFYGTDVADIITKDVKEQPYSSKRLIEIIDGLSSEYYSYKKIEHGSCGIDDFNKLICKITGIKEKVYHWGDKTVVYDMDQWIEVRFDEEKHEDTFEECPVDKNRIYKYVIQKDDGKLVAPYHTNFVYTVGENAKDDRYGLHFYYRNGIRSTGGMGKKVLLECEPVRMKADAYLPNSEVVFYEVKVLRIVPKEEEQLIIEQANKPGLPF